MNNQTDNQIESILTEYESPLDAEYETYCPCGGYGVYLGTLGCLRWYRCRACGNEYYETKE